MASWPYLLNNLSDQSWIAARTDGTSPDPDGYRVDQTPEHKNAKLEAREISSEVFGTRLSGCRLRASSREPPQAGEGVAGRRCIRGPACRTRWWFIRSTGAAPGARRTKGASQSRLRLTRPAVPRSMSHRQQDGPGTHHLGQHTGSYVAPYRRIAEPKPGRNLHNMLAQPGPYPTDF
ncbi:hypothetical protein Pen02_81580 [Plantactinospora endophytica]|uniref:Uncharacterized protein n=1 Tax=Plantactinospora endophytica TaxID=673535 RepID=A0ABQ4EER3_9ACTN|nr:hypothetical protein Pen02_81580 [Plantactinospora endophytica]